MEGFFSRKLGSSRLHGTTCGPLRRLGHPKRLRKVNKYLGAAEADVAVSTKEALDQVSSFGFNVGREFIVAIHYFLVNTKWVVIVERRVPS